LERKTTRTGKTEKPPRTPSSSRILYDGGSSTHAASYFAAPPAGYTSLPITDYTPPACPTLHPETPPLPFTPDRANADDNDDDDAELFPSLCLRLWVARAMWAPQASPAASASATLAPGVWRQREARRDQAQSEEGGRAWSTDIGVKRSSTGVGARDVVRVLGRWSGRGSGNANVNLLSVGSGEPVRRGSAMSLRLERALRGRGAGRRRCVALEAGARES
jgi:hypothetical protein